MNRLVKMIDEMDTDDVLKLKKDLEEGNIRRLIEHRLTELDENKVCPVCHKKVIGEDFILFFGRHGMKMKASFDATDCLEHFVRNLQNQENYD